MANVNTNLPTTLDFDDLRKGLRDFLSQQDEFKDYDFEGASLTQLLNVLSLNTHYNAVLANMSFGEAFLDTAIKRVNGVSRAKDIGYTPRSAKCATAIVDIDVLNPDFTPVSLVLDKYTPFTSSINGNTFTFYNTEAVSVPMTDGQYNFSGVSLREGTLITNTFTYVGGRPYFEIPNDAVDLDTLSVTVIKSNTESTRQKFSFTDEVVGVTGDSPVFFVQENSREKYEIYFGDGTIGQALVPGNLIEITYLVSSLDAANVSSTKFTQTFNLVGGIGGNSNVVIRTIANSTGGIGKEELDSIKFNAPLALKRQKRLISGDDFLSAISQKASMVESVSVWGGEENDPPMYGKVFISLKPFAGYAITESVKSTIKSDILKKEGNMLVTPVFVDPEYLYVSVDALVKFDPNMTSEDSVTIENYIKSNIQDYFSTRLSKYKSKFHFSKLQRLIDDSNDAIISNILNIRLQKRMTFPFNYPDTINFKYGLSLNPGSMRSNVFTFTVNGAANMPCSFVDDGNGNVSVKDINTLHVLAPNVGTVNYKSGTVMIKDFIVNGLVGNVEDIRISFQPADAVTDIEANRNQIILLDDSTKIATANIDSGLKVAVVTK